jgi:hypothetical protein
MNRIYLDWVIEITAAEFGTLHLDHRKNNIIPFHFRALVNFDPFTKLSFIVTGVTRFELFFLCWS